MGAAIAAKKLLLSFLMLKKLCLFAGPLEGRSVPGRAGKVQKNHDILRDTIITEYPVCEPQCDRYLNTYI